MPLILLAEEESSTIDHVRSALASQGWLVKTVGTRDQALRAASEFAPQLVLVNGGLAGAEDLVRTFCRQSGGPGVILLTHENGNGGSDIDNLDDVDAIVVKPIDTGSLIEAIRASLAASKDKPPTPPVKDAQKVFSSEEIFGDLLDDILDEEVPADVAAAEEAPVDEEPVVTASKARTGKPAKAAQETREASPPPVEEPTADREVPVPTAEAASVETPRAEAAAVEVEIESDHLDGGAGLEGLEEVVREGVEAWADSLETEERAARAEQDQLEAIERAAAAARSEVEDRTPEESEENLAARLEDTLAGVLAASLSNDSDSPVDTGDLSSGSVDALLSQALGGLDLGTDSAAGDDDTEDLVANSLRALTIGTGVAIPPKAKTEPTPPPVSIEEAEDSDEEEIEVVAEVETVEEPPTEPVEEVPVAADESVEAAERRRESKSKAASRTRPAQPSEFGEYTLESQIGAGGMASVWKARRKGVEGFEKRVAIKKILPQAAENEEFVEMFIDEAKLAAQLNHNNITHIYDLGRIGDDYFIAMEFVDGKNLRQILDQARKRESPVPPGIAFYVAARLADALDYAHRSKDFDDTDLGLVHRDVSPQNVLISYEGDIKLCDFGIAKAVSKISTTQMGALKGKLQYMSPEQAWGKAIDHRSDIFSLGSLLFELLTGERLFSGDSELAVLESVREADVGSRIVQAPSIPANAKGILLKALAREPENRYETAAELQHGLEELLKQFTPTPGPKTLSAFVRELLGMESRTDEPPAVEESSSPVVEETSDLLWEPPAEIDEENPEKSAWLRRLLTRILPVILVVAVGGGIIAGLMQRESPATAELERPVTAVQDTISSTPADPSGTVQEQDTASPPQGQPPPTSNSTTETQSTPPPQPQPREPEPQPSPEAEVPAAEAPTEAEGDATTDPDLERRVEEELQRVQELMDSSPEEVASAEDEELTPAPPDELGAAEDEIQPSDEAAVESFSLASLWSADESKGQTESSRPEDASGADSESTAEPGIVEPRLLEFEQPEYTETAREAGARGTVRVSVLVDEDGNASEVRLLEGLNQQVGLEEAVIESARNAVYEPGTKDGVPVEMWYEVAVLFEP